MFDKKFFDKKYYWTHRETRLARAKKWNRANRAKVVARSKKWRRENPEKVLAYQQLERAKVRSYFTHIEWRRKWRPNQEQLAHRL